MEELQTKKILKRLIEGGEGVFMKAVMKGRL